MYVPGGSPLTAYEPSAAVVALRVAPVAKRLGESTVRMLAYEGSIPGPTLRVRQGSQIVVRVTNDTDVETTVHRHGLRLDSSQDGVPDMTQPPIPPGGRFTYRIPFIDAGMYSADAVERIVMENNDLSVLT